VSVGYADQSHLTKRFKRLYGITPGQYRSRNWRAGLGCSPADFACETKRWAEAEGNLSHWAPRV